MRAELVPEIARVLEAEQQLVEALQQLQLVARTEEVQVLVVLDEDLHQSLDKPRVVLIDEAVDLGDSQLLDEQRELGAIDLLLLLADVLVEVSEAHAVDVHCALLREQRATGRRIRAIASLL